ncbi:MAG: hypothetical protein K2N71_11200, partial [Oscillospiraceae bacterium]|nr:hypothetical protein [Oscillospiraceae bacterium]
KINKQFQTAKQITTLNINLFCLIASLAGGCIFSTKKIFKKSHIICKQADTKPYLIYEASKRQM